MSGRSLPRAPWRTGAKRVKQRAAVGVLGKDLTRRSRGRCELCEGREGVRPFELGPFPTEPDLDRTLLACERCRRWLEQGDVDAQQARFLGAVVWSELPAVRLAAARLLLDLGETDEPWVQDARDAVDVDPATGELRTETEA